MLCSQIGEKGAVLMNRRRFGELGWEVYNGSAGENRFAEDTS
jgi:hypothetical protein